MSFSTTVGNLTHLTFSWGKKSARNINGDQPHSFTHLSFTLTCVDSMAHDQINMMNREIEGFKKANLEEQEQNETLTMQLHVSRMECTATKKRINQKLAQKEVLQAHYSTCIRVLKATERTLAGLSKVARLRQRLQSPLNVRTSLSLLHLRFFLLSRSGDCRKSATTSPS